MLDLYLLFDWEFDCDENSGDIYDVMSVFTDEQSAIEAADNCYQRFLDGNGHTNYDCVVFQVHKYSWDESDKRYYPLPEYLIYESKTYYDTQEE